MMSIDQGKPDYLFFLTYLLHLIQLAIMYVSLHWKLCLVCQVKYLNDFDSLLLFYLTLNLSQRYGVKYHLYIGETQLYISLVSDNELGFSLKNVEHCIADIRVWTTQHPLTLNGNNANSTCIASLHRVKDTIITDRCIFDYP